MRKWELREALHYAEIEIEDLHEELHVEREVSEHLLDLVRDLLARCP